MIMLSDISDFSYNMDLKKINHRLRPECRLKNQSKLPCQQFSNINLDTGVFS